MPAITVYRQFLAAISANLIGFNFGWMCSWANANYENLRSNGTSRSTQLDDGPLSLQQASLVMSLICAGGLIGNLVYLFVLEKFGRKNPILFLAIPAILSWVCIIYAKNAYWLYVSRLFCGFVGGALFISVPVFVAEICQDSLRGTLNTMGFVINSMGSLVGFIVAIYFDFRVQAVWALIIPILFVFVFYFVPESPVTLYNKNKVELADISLEFYKSANNNNNMSAESEKIMIEKKCEKDDNTISINDFVGTRAARRAVSIAIFLVFLPQFSGCYILISYTTSYFAEAGSSLTPIESSILICVVQLVANLFTMFLVDKIGRKVLFTISSAGCGLGMLVLALHNTYKHLSSNYVPIYGLSLTLFIASIGLIPIPFVITVDVLPEKIRNITMTMTSIMMWCIGFFMNIAYLNLLQVIELHGCLLVFSVGCFICALYGLLFIPETKGKSPDSVVKLLEKS